MNNTYVASGVVLLILAAALFYNLQRNAAPASTQEGVPASASVSSSTATLSAQEVAALERGESVRTQGYTIERVDIPSSPRVEAPSLSRALPPTSSLDTATHSAVSAKAVQAIAMLRKDPTSFSGWMDLASYRHALGDYAGAEEVWAYLTKVKPSAVQPFGNLARLYTTYIRDLNRAASAYHTAIALEPKNAELYRGLAEVYAMQENSAKATETLRAGFTAEPRAVDLLVLLARAHKAAGSAEEARRTYDEAVRAAETAGNKALAAQIEEEKAALVSGVQ